MSATRRPRAAAARRPALVGVLAAIAALLLPAVWAAPAQAATYRYWTYWWGSGTGPAHTGWMFAPQGPASHGVADTWVLGWRFATSTTRGGTPPRALPGYADLCPGTSPQQGSVRVALVIDYGTAADAPPGEQPPTTTAVRRECLVLPASPRPTGVTALADATPPVVVRTDGNGLICGLDGYPRTECAPVIPDPAPTPTRTATPAPTAGGAGTAAGRSPTASARPASSPAGSRSPTTAASSPARSSTSPTARATGTAAPAATAAATAAGVPLTGGEPAPSATLPAVAGAPQGSAGSTSGAGPLGVVAGVVLVGGVGLAAWWSTRRPGGAP